MDYTRLEHCTLTSPIQSKEVTLIWGNDGWCYIPDLKMRQRYTESQYFFEFWDGVIAMPEHIEQVEWILYSESPRLWKEASELFEQKPSNQTEHIRKSAPRAPRQSRQRPSQVRV